MKKKSITLILICLMMCLVACKAECPSERISYLDDISIFPPNAPAEESQPTWIKLRGKEVQVDRVITGPVCNETLSGTVYLTCDIQIPAWEENPFFFQDCDFEVEEGAVVYVEAHKDKLYDKGCSCHE